LRSGTVSIMNAGSGQAEVDWRSALGIDAEVTPLFVGNKQVESNRVFGQLLRGYRRARGKSAAQVAEAASVSASFVRSIERGDLAPSRETAEAILRFLGVKLDQERLILQDENSGARHWVIGFSADSRGDNTRQSLSQYLSLPEDQRMHVLASMFIEDPTIKRVMEEDRGKREEAERQRLRAEHFYGIPADEAPAVTRNRVFRRIAVATDDQIEELHEQLDFMGVPDPWSDRAEDGVEELRPGN